MFTIARRQLTVAVSTLALIAGLPVTANAAGNPNCVNEVYSDSFWKYHTDAFTGVPEAGGFGRHAATVGYRVDAQPEVGAVAVWAPGRAGASGSGHVAVVTAVHGRTFDIREQNWGRPPSQPGSIRNNVNVQDGITFVHVPKGYKAEKVQTGTKTEQYVTGYKTETVRTGSKNESYVVGTRTERYQSGWKDHWVWEKWRFVNRREPVYGTRQTPIYATRQVPVFATKQVPIYGTRQVAIYTEKQVPTY